MCSHPYSLSYGSHIPDNELCPDMNDKEGNAPILKEAPPPPREPRISTMPLKNAVVWQTKKPKTSKRKYNTVRARDELAPIQEDIEREKLESRSKSTIEHASLLRFDVAKKASNPPTEYSCLGKAGGSVEKALAQCGKIQKDD